MFSLTSIDFHPRFCVVSVPPITCFLIIKSIVKIYITWSSAIIISCHINFSVWCWKKLIWVTCVKSFRKNFNFGITRITGRIGKHWNIKKIQKKARKSKIVRDSEAKIGLENFKTIKDRTSGTAETNTRSNPIEIIISQDLDKKEAVLAYAYELKNAENASRTNNLLDNASNFSKEEWVGEILQIEAEAIIQEAEVGEELRIETGFDITVVGPAIEEYFNSEKTENDYKNAIKEISENLGDGQATSTQTAEEYYGEMYDVLTESNNEDNDN